MQGMRVIRVIGLCLFGLHCVAYCLDGSTQEIKVGALLPMTGTLNSSGLYSKAAAELAVEDINIWMKRNNEPYTCVLELADTATDPDTALERVKQLDEKNVRFVVGPFSSACVEAVKPYVDENDMLVLSPGSSSVALSLPNDRIFRMVADDSNQGDAVSFYCMKQDITYVVPFYMDDSFGNSLFSSTKKWIEERGGYYDDGVKVDPKSDDFSQDVELLQQKVEAALAVVPSASVAVHVIAYGQTVQVMRLAMQSEGLSRIRWIGNDGFTENKTVLSDAEVCEFARSVGFLSPVYRLDFDFLAYVERLNFRVFERIQSVPDATALQTYDSIWLSFLAQRYAMEEGIDDCATALESVFDRIPRLYASGPIQRKRRPLYGNVRLYEYSTEGGWIRVG